jgi:hypothetical protein
MSMRFPPDLSLSAQAAFQIGTILREGFRKNPAMAPANLDVEEFLRNHRREIVLGFLPHLESCALGGLSTSIVDLRGKKSFTLYMDECFLCWHAENIASGDDLMSLISFLCCASREDIERNLRPLIAQAFHRAHARWLSAKAARR